MFQFRLGRFPVAVHFSHFIVSGLIAWSFAQSPRGGSAWPDSILSQPSHPQHTQTVVAVVLLWMAMIGLSVLAHELGHAASARFFGYPPHIQLIGLGGQTWAEGSEAMPWHQDVLHTLAGPAAGLMLGVLGGVGLLGLSAVAQPPPAAAAYVLESLFYANLVWTVLNLLPLATLDGGRITSTVLTRFFGRPGFLGAQIISLLLASGLFLVALYLKDFLMLALVFMLGMRTYANLSAWHRGELPRGQAAHPLVLELERAEQALREGHLEEAERLGRALLAGAPVPLVKSRANLLVGWVLLKRGQGRGALEHFQHVRDQELPAQALAAAFSLAGDETRALPLWAQAAQQSSGNEVILHEFAGALVRAGRELDARRLNGVKMAMAFAAAERVYYVRGEYEKAAQMAEAAFREEPTFSSAYDAACAYSRAQQPEAAMRMLALAAQNGFKDAGTARADPDLSAMRERPEFQAWLASLEGAGATEGAAG